MYYENDPPSPTILNPVLMDRPFNFWTRRVGVEPCYTWKTFFFQLLPTFIVWTCRVIYIILEERKTNNSIKRFGSIWQIFLQYCNVYILNLYWNWWMRNWIYIWYWYVNMNLLKCICKLITAYYGRPWRYINVYHIYIYVWKLNQTVVELDFRAVKFLFFPRLDLNPHH